MIKVTAVLIVVVSTSSCALDNIDGAEVIHIPMGSTVACQHAAELIDPRIKIRAYCQKGETE